MLSQRGKEILARRPPLFNDDSSLDRNASTDSLESGCKSYVVQLPAHEIEEVAGASHRGESYRTSRHSFMAISSAILLSVAAIVLLALDSGNVQDLSSAVLLSKHPAEDSKPGAAVKSVLAVVAHPKQNHDSSTRKEIHKMPLHPVALKSASTSVSHPKPLEKHDKVKEVSQTSSKHKIPKAEAKSLRAAARSKAGAALFARAVRSTEMALSHPLELANRMESLQSSTMPAQAPPLPTKARQIQRAQYAQYPAYSMPPASYPYRPAAVPSQYPTGQQGGYYPNPYRQQAYVRPPQYAYPYQYPAVQAGEPYAVGPSVSAYTQPIANMGNPTAYTSLNSAPIQSISPQGQGTEGPYGGQQVLAKYSQPTAVMSQQPFQPGAGLYNPEQAPQPAQRPQGPVLKGTWQYPTYRQSQQAAATSYPASPMLARQPVNFAPAAEYIQAASPQQMQPQVELPSAAQSQLSAQQPPPQAPPAAPQPQAQAQLQPPLQSAPAAPARPADVRPAPIFKLYTHASKLCADVGFAA